MKKTWVVLIILFCAVIFLAGARLITDSIEYQNSDFFQFWLGSRSIWDGSDPYNSADWIKDHREFGTDRIAAPAYLYPLPLAIFLSPIGALPLKEAFIIWTFLSASLLLISILLLLSAQNFQRSKHLILPIILANIIFRPTTTTFLGGQFSIWLLFFATLAAILWHRDRWFLGGFLISFLTLKPSVGFPLLFILSPWLLARKKFPAFAGMALAGLFFLAVGLIKDPFWIPKYIDILTTKLGNEFGTSPTIWGFSAMACSFEKDCTAWVGTVFLIIFLLLNFWLFSKWRFSSPILALGHLISISLLSTLYLWPYDHILLIIPIVFTMVTLLQKGLSYLKVSFIFLLISLVAIIIRVFTVLTLLEKETLFGILPLLVWGMTTGMLISSQKKTDPLSD